MSMHVFDQTARDSQNKFTKGLSFRKKLNEKWMKYSPEYHEVSIDESIMPYYHHDKATYT